VQAFQSAWPRTRVVFAGKAGLNGTLIRLMTDEGLGLDVVSGGELAIALAAGFDPGKISFHGNNKATVELREAVDHGVGKIVVDNLDEVARLADVAASSRTSVDVLLRINPGVDVHTHRKISTGIADSKFGVPIANGQARDVVRQLQQHPELHLRGYHMHLGSQLFDDEAFVAAINEAIEFAADIKRQFGVELEHFSPGGGFGIGYVEGQIAPTPAYWAQSIATALRDACRRYDVAEPVLTVEPGRSITGPAGIAVYTAGSIKDIPGIRTYVAVDGGMADNIRPSLYDAAYTAVIANRDTTDGPGNEVAVAGRYCESGDILIECVSLPDVSVGDIIAVPASGAYSLPMASNYNGALRPAVVMVSADGTTIMKHRETYDDLFRHDPVLELTPEVT
jgi:diaminopimelate decarboxylase